MSVRGDELLPGVRREEEERRSRTYDGRRVVAEARRREDLHDLVDLLILAAVDGFLLAWEPAHIPGLSRPATMQVMLVVNIALAAALLLRRLVPVLRARRIARTWNDGNEQKKERRP